MNKKQRSSLTAFAILFAALALTGCATFQEPSVRTQMIAMNVATLVDVESTFLVMRHCGTCVEANPFMRPAVHRGRVITYGFSFGVNALIARRARRSLIERVSDPGYARSQKNSFWYYLPYSVTGSHYLAALLNLRLAHQQQRAQPVP